VLTGRWSEQRNGSTTDRDQVTIDGDLREEVGDADGDRKQSSSSSGRRRPRWFFSGTQVGSE
jgi:hypothetical protein